MRLGMPQRTFSATRSQELRGPANSGLVPDPNARFACGSMVLLFSFSQKNPQREFFCEKDLVISALPEPALSVVEWGDIPRQTRDRLIHSSTGSFAGFVHVVVFVVQTPTA
jgi:hypothetical protein